MTASIIAGSCTVAIRSSSAIGAGTVRICSRTPSSRASRMVRSTRIGDIGWLGPKSYSVRVGSKTTVAGPGHAGMPATLPVEEWAYGCSSVWSRAAVSSGVSST